MTPDLEAIEDDYLSRLDWLWKERGCNNDDPIYSMFSSFLPILQGQPITGEESP